MPTFPLVVMLRHNEKVLCFGSHPKCYLWVGLLKNYFSLIFFKRNIFKTLVTIEKGNDFTVKMYPSENSKKGEKHVMVESIFAVSVGWTETQLFFF